jgi:hypothetical protein
MKTIRNFFLPSLADMLFLSIFLYLSFSWGASLLGDCDTGYHIRAGEWILSHMSVPRHDMFSFISPTLPWTAHEWLSEVIMALIHKASGLTGIVVFFTFILSLVFYLLFRMIRASDGNILTAVLFVLLATAASQVHWLARPHVFSLLLFFLWYRILDDYVNGKRTRLILLPPMLLVWVNLHGGYLSGFMLLGIYLIGELPAVLTRGADGHAEALQRFKGLAVTILVCLPVACINPYGWHILFFPFNLVSNKLIMDNVTEFMSPNFHEPSPFKYLILLLVAVLALSREKLRLTDLLLLAVFLNMSLFSVRYIPLFAIVAAPILSRRTDVLLENSQCLPAVVLKERAEGIAAIDRAAGGLLLPILAVIGVACTVASGMVRYGFDPNTKPVQAVRFIEKAGLEGNMFNNDEFGDYVIYAAWPRYRVFFDGRSDMYGTAILKEYMQVTGFEDGWEKTLDKYRINWIFFNSDSRFTRFLKERKDWVLIYQDKIAAIFIRNIPRNRSIIERYQTPRETRGMPVSGDNT